MVSSDSKLLDDRKGKHLGEFDPITGEQLKQANPDYEVEP
ncbi:colicin E3/pyocin S6 family cytotoxin [Phormidesmis sp. 146-35]